MCQADFIRAPMILVAKKQPVHIFLCQSPFPLEPKGFKRSKILNLKNRSVVQCWSPYLSCTRPCVQSLALGVENIIKSRSFIYIKHFLKAKALLFFNKCHHYIIFSQPTGSDKAACLQGRYSFPAGVPNGRDF